MADLIKVIKKDKTIEDFDEQKIIDAVTKSAKRALVNLTPTDYHTICNEVFDKIEEEDYYDEKYDMELVPVSDLHSIVEETLITLYPTVGEQYRQYRNYKLDFAQMLDEVYTKSQGIRYIGDVSNANSDSTLVSTQRSLIYGELNRALYKKFFLTKEELQAVNDGYIYIHDMKDRLDSINCCLFDYANLLKGGFEMGNVWYNEPKTLDVAFDVIGDGVFGASAQQYGGHTLPQVDNILEPYAEKSYQIYLKEFYEVRGEYPEFVSEDIKLLADKYAESKVRRDFEQGFQGWEYKFNTVGSSRGDYPFIAISFGINTSRWGAMASEVALETRKNGQGKKGFKKPVLFPKLTFLYDKNLHGDGSDAYPLGWLFEKAIDCSCKTMYPDYLSLTGEGYVASIYKKYGKVISLMG